MAISFRDSASQSFPAAVSANKTFTLPATLVPGDLILCLFGVPASTSTPTGAPTGYAAVPGAAGTDGADLTSYYKFAVTGDAGSTVTVTETAPSRAEAHIVAYSGVDRTTPFGPVAVATEAGSSTAHGAASLVTSATGWIVRGIVGKDASTSSTTLTQPAGTTMRTVFTGDSMGGTGQIYSAVSDSNGDVAAGTYAGNWTTDQAGTNAVNVAISLRPATSTTTVNIVSDVTTTGLSIVGGASGAVVLSDGSSSTYVETPAGGTYTYEGAFATPAAPLPSFTVKYLTPGATTVSATFAIYMGATLIASFGPETTVTATEVTKTYSLTSGQQSAQTNLANLRLRATITVA